MSDRLEAAVKAWDHHWGDRYGDEAVEEMGEEVAVALAAADAVDPLRNPAPEDIERAAKALHDLGCAAHPWPWERRDEELQDLYREDVRAVVAALKGEAS